MISLALTGGIATGKSTFARLFCTLVPDTVFFDSDACVHDLLTRRGIVASIAGSLGQDLSCADGSLDRGRLRELVFRQPECRRVLEGILHPLVRESCAALQKQAGESGKVSYFLADVPLLYESGFPLQRDLDIAVGCGPQTQRARLMVRSGMTPDLAEKILAAQLPVAEKLDRADVALWNGGSTGALRRQTEHFLLWLKNKSSN